MKGIAAMAVQMYLIQPKNNHDDAEREVIAELVADRGGFILMTTSYGSLIVALDEAHQGAIGGHPLVAFVGGVTLNPGAPGAAALQRLFAANVALQLAGRASPDGPGFPPGYKPMRWPRRDTEGGD
jgi:hypothetical protein